MAHLVSGDDKFPDFGYDDDYRFYLITRRDALGDYRFARKHGKRVRVHARNALRHVKGYFRNMIEAIADAKLRRMDRPEGPGPKGREKRYEDASATQA
jgi:hypothetical protein